MRSPSHAAARGTFDVVHAQTAWAATPSPLWGNRAGCAMPLAHRPPSRPASSGPGQPGRTAPGARPGVSASAHLVQRLRDTSGSRAEAAQRRDLQRFSPRRSAGDAAVLARLGLPRPGPLCLMVGGIEARKNTVRLLQAFARLRRRPRPAAMRSSSSPAARACSTTAPHAANGFAPSELRPAEGPAARVAPARSPMADWRRCTAGRGAGHALAARRLRPGGAGGAGLRHAGPGLRTPAVHRTLRRRGGVGRPDAARLHRRGASPRTAAAGRPPARAGTLYPGASRGRVPPRAHEALYRLNQTVTEPENAMPAMHYPLRWPDARVSELLFAFAGDQGLAEPRPTTRRRLHAARAPGTQIANRPGGGEVRLRCSRAADQLAQLESCRRRAPPTSLLASASRCCRLRPEVGRHVHARHYHGVDRRRRPGRTVAPALPEGAGIEHLVVEKHRVATPGGPSAGTASAW